MKKLVLALFAAAVLAPAAAAGGFATVGLSSLPPDDLDAGAAWSFDMTILQHGRTPLEGVQPVVRLRGPKGQLEEFAAAPTKKAGVYHAVVKFPARGTWSYEIWDGFSQTHTYKPVAIGAPSSPVATPTSKPAPAPSPSAVPTLPVGIALGLLFAAALVFFLRRLRSAPQAAPLGR